MGRTFTGAALVLLVMALSACATTRAAPPGRPSDVPAVSFDRLEDEILRELAVLDPRVARRARIRSTEEERRRVSMAALLREDPSVVIVDGAIDPFSFDARARGLALTRAKADALPDDPRHHAERELIGRALDAETSRLAEERLLPRSASALIRAIVETWEPPKTPANAAELDAWLARRLAEVRESLSASSAETLDVVATRELDDALDGLERLAASPFFVATTQELVRLREALEAAASLPAAKAHSDWDRISRRLQAHLGLDASANTLATDLERLASDLRRRAGLALEGAHLSRDGLTLESSMFLPGPCTQAVPGSRIRSMAAPPEREPAFHLRELAMRASEPSEQARLLAVLHDHVVVGLWALDVARGASTIADAEAKHRLFLPILPGARARYERIAVARPVASIGAAYAVAILVAGDWRARASAWALLGDVPLDIAAAELSASTSR